MLKNRNVPFGYCVVNGKYAVNAIEAEAVRQIFKQYIGGKSLKAIATEMTVPYMPDKPNWNKSMVCRVLENRKYLGENGFPKIISYESLEQAAQIKLSRRTTGCTIKKRDNNMDNKPQIIHTVYEPTEEIEQVTDEINRLLETENTDKNAVAELIIKCAQLKYSALKTI